MDAGQGRGAVGLRGVERVGLPDIIRISGHKGGDALQQSLAQGQVVSPANFNSPGQLVIAGNAEAVDRALAKLAEQGVKKAIKLAVSVPSHCMLMRDAADRLGERMASISWTLPAIPVVQNAEARSPPSIEYLLFDDQPASATP